MPWVEIPKMKDLMRHVAFFNLKWQMQSFLTNRYYYKTQLHSWVIIFCHLNVLLKQWKEKVDPPLINFTTLSLFLIITSNMIFLCESPTCFQCACLLVTKYSLEANDGRLVADNNWVNHANIAMKHFSIKVWQTWCDLV